MLDIRVFNFMEKRTKNNLRNFSKNSPFAKLKPRAKHTFLHALSHESQALSAQHLHLRLI